MKQYIDLITRIARRYTLPPKCAITHDDLIQEACLALLEANVMSLTGELNSPQKAYAIARKAMQRAMTRYISPVTRSLDTVLYTDDAGNPITFADTIADDSAGGAASDCEPSPSLSEALWGRGAEGGEGAALSFLSSLSSQLAAGTITPANYRQKKHRFLKKLRRQVSQNRDSPV